MLGCERQLIRRDLACDTLPWEVGGVRRPSRRCGVLLSPRALSRAASFVHLVAGLT
jgi:hypothetical protein